VSKPVVGLVADAPVEVQSADDVQKAARLKTIHEHLKGAEEYFARSWAACDAILAGGDDRISIFAIQRAYFAVYRMCLVTAISTGIDLNEYRNKDDQHRQEAGAIPHARLPLLAERLMNLVSPPDKLGSGEGSPRAKQVFATVRVLQKHRMRADYMGCERVSAQGARECIEWAKKIVQVLWEYICEHSDYRPAAGVNEDGISA
jgi:hypothetical protein